ncbi:hypothetical protein AAMO2058_000433900 [Amorphochlora amoebiformis]
MITKTFVGRRHQAGSSQPTAKDALNYVSSLNPKKKIRVIAKTTLVFGDEVDLKGSSHAQEIKTMADEITAEEAKTKVRLKVRGMIYFNAETAECMQVMEGKPPGIHDSLKHILRDVRHSGLTFQIEAQKIKRRFRNWGSVWAQNTQQWKMVKLMWPTEEEWKRLTASMTVDAESLAFSRRDSLVEEVEAKKAVMEYLGADCRRIWRRRDSICSLVMSTQELGYLRQRHEIAKKMLRGELKQKRTWSCFDDPDVEENLEVTRKAKNSQRPKKKPGEKSRRGSVVTSRSNRVSVSRSSILDVLSAEETGFVENVEEMQAYVEGLKEETQQQKQLGRKFASQARSKIDKKASLEPQQQKIEDEKVNSPPPRIQHFTPAQDAKEDEKGLKNNVIETAPTPSPVVNEPEVKAKQIPKQAPAEEFKSIPLVDEKKKEEIKVHTISHKASVELTSAHVRHIAISDEKLSWQLVQAIGPDENAVAGSTNQDDYVTSLQLDPSGNYIAIGDSQGRIGIFDASESGDQIEDPYQFYEEFVSHHPDFDTLYSRRIPTNIIAVEWLKNQNRSLHVLATNEKTIKLWRLKEIRKEGQQTQIIPVLSKEFAKGHQRFFIHSLSTLSDGETFISADELMLNMWNLERPESHFTLIDDLPEQEDIVEVNRIITSAKADPLLCHRFLYTTSVNEINVCDLRARLMQNKPALILNSPMKFPNMTPEVIRELQCITDADFALDGYSLVTRSFSNVRLWDLRKPTGPTKTMTVHEQNPSQFSDLCTSGCLVDDFRVAVNRDATGVVTGSYDDYFVAYDLINGRKKWLQARHAHDVLGAEKPRMTEIGRKVLHVDWHDERDIITVASSHSVYVYELRPDDDSRSRAEESPGRYAYA